MLIVLYAIAVGCLSHMMADAVNDRDYGWLPIYIILLIFVTVLFVLANGG